MQPREPALTRWATAFADAPPLTAATRDRLPHHARIDHTRIVQFTGKSDRLKDKRNAGQTTRAGAKAPTGYAASLRIEST
ncbi:hypothetical protein [Pandoraea oxalativorans]|uniref:Uncharacterized protein n=1 Tax=Pandoraea oxalativorans TaxID=573737 RepID=A0A192B100_9BURK|nr:hypothetical protein [Pandoraea oxalativorans]ANJ86759.1 hypothetical protein MB84_31390 [Pandoraea oxalativorans]